MARQTTLVKDVFLAGPLTEIRGQFNRHAPNHVGVVIRDLDLAEARARVEAALYMLDHTYDPPVNEDVRPLRALVDARLRLLPHGFELPDEYRAVAPEERDALLADFLGSPEGQRWVGDDDAEDVAQLAIDFGAGYNHGGPLRWSPVVVEIFITSWLARKVTREPEFFTQVPDVLRDWVKYAGRRRGVPSAPLREAVAAVKHYRKGDARGRGRSRGVGPGQVVRRRRPRRRRRLDRLRRDRLELIPGRDVCRCPGLQSPGLRVAWPRPLADVREMGEQPARCPHGAFL